MKVFPSYALSSGMLYSAGKKLLNETREYTAAEIFNATQGGTGTRLSKSVYEDAIASLPPRTNITLESYDLANMGGDMIALGCHIILWIIVCIIVESSYFALCRCCQPKRHKDMRFRHNRVDEIDARWNQHSLIKVTNLQKTYSTRACGCKCHSKRSKEVNIDALEGTNFHVFEHECFSLLGENGAGKSTSFKILTKEENRTGGTIELLGLEAETHWKQIAKEMGYCPQDDVLFDLLTVEEHLKFYAELRCLENREEHIDAMIMTLQLETERDKLSQNLSGGNKRKLSVGIALIAKPRLILLDEPSTGVDPAARYHMWHTIGAFQQR